MKSKLTTNLWICIFLTLCTTGCTSLSPGFTHIEQPSPSPSSAPLVEHIHLQTITPSALAARIFGTAYINPRLDCVVFTISSRTFAISRFTPIHIVLWDAADTPLSFYYLPEHALYLAPEADVDKKALLKKTITLHVTAKGLLFPIDLPHKWCVAAGSQHYTFSIAGIEEHAWGLMENGEIRCPNIPVYALLQEDI